MEREARIANLALAQHIVHELLIVERLYVMETLLIERVQQIEIQMIGLQAAQLLVKQTLHVVVGLDQPYGQFAGKRYLFAIAVPERLSNQHFTHAPMIAIGGIDIRYAVVDCIAYKCDCFRLVYRAVFVGRQAHTANAEQRGIDVRTGKIAMFHNYSSLIARVHISYIEYFKYVTHKQRRAHSQRY